MLAAKSRNYSRILKRMLSVGDGVELLAQNLNERTLIKLSGKDSNLYLQGLITNDMHHLKGNTSGIFTMFLNNKGRVLYDSMVYNSKSDNTYFIECDSPEVVALKNHLLHYKVRRKTSIDHVGEEFSIWAIAKNNCLHTYEDTSDYKKICSVLNEKLPHLIVTCDPRLINMGLRILAPKGVNICTEIENKTGLKVTEGTFYKLLRYKLGIAEGTKELPPEKCFPMEINGDYMHGISFHKGCYIGQELTARTYHTGVIRKRVMPLIFEEEILMCPHGTPIFVNEQSNKSVGKLYGAEQTSGVALLRIEEALKSDELILSSQKCKTYHPFWWPIEAPKTRMNTG